MFNRQTVVHRHFRRGPQGWQNYNWLGSSIWYRETMNRKHEYRPDGTKLRTITIHRCHCQLNFSNKRYAVDVSIENYHLAWLGVGNCRYSWDVNYAKKKHSSSNLTVLIGVFFFIITILMIGITTLNSIKTEYRYADIISYVQMIIYRYQNNYNIILYFLRKYRHIGVFRF